MMKSKTKLDPKKNYNRRNSPTFVQTLGMSDSECAGALRKILNGKFYEETVMKIGYEEYQKREATKQTA